jgi:poly(3-hydroxybutyrate) depolymerase
MLEPDSLFLVAVLIAVSAALLLGAVRLRPLPAKIGSGALSILVAMAGGILSVNHYYGYYTTWGQAWADYQGGTGNLGVISSASVPPAGAGRIGWTALPGRLSGYNRAGLVYLPPQYGQAKYARVRFPVVELFHGSPGSPRAWNTVLRISSVADALLARRLIGPMVLVMPAINPSRHHYQECVNAPGLSDETYLTRDVRADMLARYRISHDPFQWGLAGYSSGGYCAANLALRNPGSFGAAASIEGYFRAADGPAAAALNYSKPQEAANSPLYLAERLRPGGGPVPAFWVAAGTGEGVDYRTATVFATALNRIQQVAFVRLNARDTGNAWIAALPSALVWLWQQLAPPDLRVLFPVRTDTPNPIVTLPVPPPRAPRYGGPGKTATGRGPGRPSCDTPGVATGLAVQWRLPACR